MRGFMIVSCNIWFTTDMKIEAFLGNVLRLYYIPDDKIQEAIDFVKDSTLHKSQKIPLTVL